MKKSRTVNVILLIIIAGLLVFTAHCLSEINRIGNAQNSPAAILVETSYSMPYFPPCSPPFSPFET